MTFLIENWTLILLALASGGLAVWSTWGNPARVAGLSASEAVQLMNREKALVVDVCSPQEYAAGHVKGARNVPLADLQAQLPSVAKSKSQALILVCASGVRSARAVAVARQLGYEQVYSLAGGMGAWRAASLPVQKG